MNTLVQIGLFIFVLGILIRIYAALGYKKLINNENHTEKQTDKYRIINHVGIAVFFSGITMSLICISL